MKDKIKKFFDFLASYGLTIVLLLAFMVIVTAGTIAQRDIGLYQSQQKYFNSLFFFFVLEPVEGHLFKIPFPSAFTVLTLLFFNLCTSFVLKFRWQKRAIGLWICHIGIFALLLGSFVTFLTSQDGYVSLRPGQKKDEFSDYHEYELVVTRRDDKNKERLVARFSQGELAQEEVLQSEKIPFDIKIKDFFQNARYSKKPFPSNSVGVFGSKGVHLQKLKTHKEFERNRAGCELLLIYQGKSLGQGGLVAGDLFRFEFKDAYTLWIRKKRTSLPFVVELIDTKMKKHPGTEMAKHYESTVRIIDGDSSRKVLISMNRPLRHKGYTFYQSGFGQQGNIKESTLAVMSNPAALAPYFSCFLILLGMIIHFFQKLLRFLKKRKKRAAKKKEKLLKNLEEVEK